MEASLERSSLMSSERLLVCCKCDCILSDPVQLSCLHNCCQSCIDQEAVAKGHIVSCSLCEEQSVHLESKNSFIASHIRFMSILKGPARCDICVTKGFDEHGDAEYLCRNCQTLICFECLSSHDRHNDDHAKVPFEDIRSSSDIAAISLLPCLKHGKNFDHVCLSCEAAMCGTCASSCLTQRHDVQVLYCARTDDYASTIRREIEELQIHLGDVSSVLKQHEDVAYALKEVRKTGLEILRKNKITILEAVERAYQAAENSLQDACDLLDVRALDLVSSSQLLQKRISSASVYSSRLMDSKDIANLVQQQKTVRSRLKQLSEELLNLQPKVGEVSYINMEGGALPEDLDQVLSQWIGAPKLIQGSNEVWRREDYEKAQADEEKRQMEQQVEFALEEDSGLLCSALDSTDESASPSPSCSTSVSPIDSFQRYRPDRLLPRVRTDFQVKCAGCRHLVTTSDKLWIFSSKYKGQYTRHHVLSDTSFVGRIRIHQHLKPGHIGETLILNLEIVLDKKVSCKECGDDWGSCARIARRYFFFLKSENLVVEAGGRSDKINSWWNLPYKLGFIKDYDLLKFGIDEIPADEPRPTKWILQVPTSPTEN